MEYLQELILELDSNTSYTTIGVKQGDNLSRVIKVHLTQNGEDYEIEDGTRAYFRFRKPDGKAVVNAATIEDNNIYVALTSQTLAAPGRGYADITLQKDDRVLSTVSFIIIIMAAPGVVDQIVSSNEFGYLNDILSSANTTIYESEAWAVGSRSGVPVVSSEEFIVTFSGIIDSVSPDEDAFYDRTRQQDGLRGQYTFIFESSDDDNEYWRLEYSIQDGSIITSGTTTLASGLQEYGISYTTVGGTPPNPGDTITIIAQKPDRTYQNNAKYYSEQAREEVQSVVDLEVSAVAGASADVVKYKDAETNAWHFDFTLPLPALFSPTTTVHTVPTDPTTGEPGDAAASITVVEGTGADSGKVGYQFELWIPQGAKGADGTGSVSSVDQVPAVDHNVQLNAIRYTSQSLTSAQMTVARENIGIYNWGVITTTEIDNIISS